MKPPEHNHFTSRSMAYQVAHLLWVITGDTVDVVKNMREGRYSEWHLVRTDPAGKEIEV